MHAEDAYLFRHALVREGAYQLLLPEQRSRLHELAMQSLEALFGDALKSVAHELADHAAHAREEGRDGDDARLNALAGKEMHYLRQAAEYAQQAYRMEDAIRLWDRLEAHPALSDTSRLEVIEKSAVARSNSGRLPEAECRLREAIDSGGEPVQIARLRLGLGAVLYNRAQLPEAAEQYELAIPVLEAEGPTEALARACVNMGACRQMLGQKEGVEAAYLRGAEIARQAGYAGLEAQIVGNLGNLHHRRGDWARAERDYIRSLELAVALNDLRQESAVCTGLGIGFFEAGEAAKAVEYLTRAVERARQANDRYRVGEALVNLASVGAEHRAPEETLRLHDEAMEIHRETGNVWGEASAQIGRSAAYLRTGELGPAREALLVARKLATSVNDRDREGVVLLRLGLVELEADRLEQAQAYWREGRRVLDTSRMHRNTLYDDMIAACERKGVPPLRDDRVESE